ncbi:glucosyltransferase [Nostoc sp. T09]|uniref:glycosyltransferase n=1 Tax=Nostoc sp. T09 TaxID=1932621 RepID=UPI000A37186D|nr:glycosyltransferase family 2 protein [Nostoc sp. T09]OUL18749.1 glucosyltransferase [Nostoc sp. T09]
MTSINELSFIIVSWNSAQTLRGAIESCLSTIHQYYPRTGRIVVYDNASVDTCPQILDEFTRKYPNTFIGIKGKQNLGFATGNNRAVVASPSRMYVLVNPDVTFKPEVITKLATTLNSDRDIAIVCPKLVYLDRSVQPSIRRFPTFTYLLLKQLLGETLQTLLHPFDYYYEQMPPPQKAVEVNWAIGAFMMISGEYIARYGLFDERFFLYFEDVSLCLDAWQNGYRVLFQPEASALHLYQRSSTSSLFNYLRLVHIVSALKFFIKYRPYQKRWQLVLWLLQMNSQVKNSLRLLTSVISRRLQKNIVSIRRPI